MGHSPVARAVIHSHQGLSHEQTTSAAAVLRWLQEAPTRSETQAGRQEMKQAAPWVFALLASITSVSFHIDAQGVKVELKRTQQQLAAAQQDNFGLASAACELEK